MLNRRNFFAKLSSAIAGIYLASQVKLPSIDSLLSAPEEPVAVRQEINPEWMTAPYEIAFLTHELTKDAAIKLGKVETIVYKRSNDVDNKPKNVIYDCYPIRMNLDGEVVQPFREYKG